MLCLNGLEGLPNGAVALEAGAEAKLPQLLSLLDALLCLNIAPCIPARRGKSEFR